MSIHPKAVKQIRVRKRTLHRIPCPYCRVGHGVFVTITTVPTNEVEGNAADPIKCTQCERYFRIKPTIVFNGEKLEHGS